MRQESVRLEIKDREAFGRLCVALSENRVSFTHGGFQTLFVLEPVFDSLPAAAAKVYLDLERRGLVAITRSVDLAQPRRGRRPLTSPKAAATLMEKYFR